MPKVSNSHQTTTTKIVRSLGSANIFSYLDLQKNPQLQQELAQQQLVLVQQPQDQLEPQTIIESATARQQHSRTHLKASKISPIVRHCCVSGQLKTTRWPKLLCTCS